MDNKSLEILFEKFEVIEILKKDAHAGVYLANHKYLGKKIILKALNVNTISDDTIVERFKREAKILARLEHPNIIKVLDFGTYQEYFYISFEYFESRNLRQIINDNNLSDEQNRKLVVQLLHGLGFAHQNGIIHRDIKPENILVNEIQELKLGDFGLALSAQDNYVTRQYSIVGTPSYMSPEQINGEVLTPQTDLFSVGIVILELYCGNNPFLGKDINDSLNKISNIEDSRFEENVKNIPEEISALLRGLLVKELSSRIKTVDDAFNIIGESLDSSPGAFQKVSQAKRSIRKSAVLLIIILSAATLIIYLAFNQTDSNSVENLNEPPMEEDLNKSEILDTTVLDDKSQNNKIENFDNPVDIDNTNEKAIPPGDGNISSAVNGRLFVECFPWADLYIDGIKFETTPIKDLIDLESGQYIIKLVHPEFPVYEESIQILSNEITNVRVNLDTLLGFMDCKIFPWGQLFLDDIYKGDTPFSEPLKLLPGNYNLKINNPDYGIHEEKIIISKNDTLKFYYNYAN